MAEAFLNVKNQTTTATTSVVATQRKEKTERATILKNKKIHSSQMAALPVNLSTASLFSAIYHFLSFDFSDEFYTTTGKNHLTPGSR